MNFTEVQICITEIEFSSFFTVNYSVNITNWNISEKPGGDRLVSAQKLEPLSEEGRMKCIHIGGLARYGHHIVATSLLFLDI